MNVGIVEYEKMHQHGGGASLLIMGNRQKTRVNPEKNDRIVLTSGAVKGRHPG